MNVNVDVYTNGILKKETVGYNNSIDANIIAGIIPKMKDQSGGEPCKYLLSKLYEIVRYDLCEIWSFKSETTNIGDVKKAVYPEKRKFPVKFKNLSHLKATTVPTISNNIKYRLVKQRSSLNSSKRGISAPAKIDRITCTSPKKDTSAISFPINVGKSLGIVIFYKYGIFECAVLSKLLPYIQFIKNIFEGAEQTENISGGSIRRTQENDEIKDTFLASVSHELRTPLNGIVGMISMLRDAGPLTDKQNEYLVILMECSHQLMTMLNNMLDFNKMVSKRLALLRISFDIHQCAEDAILMATGKAKNKGLEIKLEISKDIPRHLIGDPQRFIQILTNLLSNSIKFTEKGHILLKINGELEGLPEEYVKKWKISVEVHDTGVGIPQEDQEKIFNGFYQSQTLTKDMAQGGTGLGLSISRELIKLMNGNISVSSNPGQGTVFSFYIYSEEEIRIDSLESPETLKILKGSKVMIVDDRAEYRLQITEILFKLDCIPTAVSSGEEVLQYIKYGSNYDTIIVDICMPYMSGVELAQNLIQYEKQIGSNHTPLLALSSVELQGGIELFDVYLNKPIDQNSLFPALMKCLRLKKAAVGDTPVFLKKSPRREKKERGKLNILIAEDDPNNSYTMKEMLSYLGFNKKRIKCVPNGQKCVEESKTHDYDVILMDIIMPVMDGIEATKYIRLRPVRPYIIAVSAAVQNTDRQRCQQVGIDGYLPKPVIKEKLEASLAPLII